MARRLDMQDIEAEIGSPAIEAEDFQAEDVATY